MHCEYLNIDGKMKPCDLDPHECVMGFRGIVSEDGLQFTPIEQPSIEATLRNCPKLKNRVYKYACGYKEGTQIKEDDGQARTVYALVKKEQGDVAGRSKPTVTQPVVS